MRGIFEHPYPYTLHYSTLPYPYPCIFNLIKPNNIEKLYIPSITLMTDFRHYSFD